MSSAPFTPSARRAASARRLALRGASCCAALAGVPCSLLAQSPTVTKPAEVVAGQVRDSAGRPVANAIVSVTRGPDRAFLVDTTRDGGTYRVRFTPGHGDYLVHVAAVGFRPLRQRVRNPGPDTAIAVNVVLAAQAAQQLARMRVVAPPPPAVERQPSAEPGVGAAEIFPDGVTAGLPTDAQASVGALAALAPGATAVPGGIALLGLGPEQSRTTLNGLAFGGDALPRDARTRTRVTTSAYDPGIGGFSSGAIAIDLAPGGDIATRTTHFSVDDPHAQSRSDVSRALGSSFSRLDAGHGSSGPIVLDRWYHSEAVQVVLARAPTADVFTASPRVGALAGTPDSAMASLRAQAAGPTNGGPLALRRTDLTAIGRVDRTPGGAVAWGATGYAHVDRWSGLGLGPFDAASRAYDSLGLQLNAQLTRSARFRTTGLSETRTGIGVARAITTAERDGPVLRVQLADTIAPALVGAARLGGAGTRPPKATDVVWDLTHDVVWYAPGASAHRLKASLQSRVDAASRDVGGVDAGVYDFASPAALGAGQPTAFTRRLVLQSTRGAVWNGALAFGDYWKSDRLQVTYGVRLDASQYLTSPATDALLERELGVDTHRLPATLHLGPRLGFTYVYRKPSGFQVGMLSNALGAFYTRPVGVLRGGIGEFRSLAPATLGMRTADGAALDGRLLTCAGSDVPPFDADASSAVDSCGSTATRETVRALTFTGEAHRPPRSWRANLAWESTWKGHALTIEGIGSVNLDQPSAVDLNFPAEPAFRLVEEELRPVYAPVTAINGYLGVTDGGAVRPHPALGAVLQRVSDARSVSTSLRLGLSSIPQLGATRFYYGATYVLGHARGRQRGFYGTTAGDPSALETGPSALDLRHQLTTQLGWAAGGVAATLFVRAASGFAFSPLVDRDINGDGFANDRAFLAAAPSAGGLDTALRALIDASPGRLQRCLRAQLGHLAAANSCRGPWMATVNARLDAGAGTLHLSPRVHVGIGATNILAGLDQLAHGSTRLRGWGASGAPDAVLLNVRDYDAAGSRYVYSVNPRFGAPDPLSSYRTPFRLTVDVAIDLSAPFNEQMLNTTLARERSAERPRAEAEAAIRQRYARSVLNLYDGILQLSDSLLLTRDQADSLTAARARYMLRMDSVWKPLAHAFADRPPGLTDAQALALADSATDRAWHIVHEQQPVVKAILSPIQLRLLPQFVALLVNSKEVARVQMSFMR